MEPRASARLRFGVLTLPSVHPSVRSPGSLSCYSLTSAEAHGRDTRARYTHTQTRKSLGPASALPDAPSSLFSTHTYAQLPQAVDRADLNFVQTSRRAAREIIKIRHPEMYKIRGKKCGSIDPSIKRGTT